MNLNLRNISALPAGAVYNQKQGRATVSIQKLSDSIYTVTADCDSLSILVTEKETEIYRLQNRVRDMEDRRTETIINTVREPKPWQWFFVYSGYLLWGEVLIGLILIFIKWKLKR